MNIDDLREDIAMMEEEIDSGVSKNATEYFDLLDIADMYDEDRDKCVELIEKFRDKHGYKINII